MSDLLIWKTFNALIIMTKFYQITFKNMISYRLDNNNNIQDKFYMIMNHRCREQVHESIHDSYVMNIRLIRVSCNKYN